MRATVLVAALVAVACGSDDDGDSGGSPGCTAETATATTSVQLVAGDAFVPSCIRVAPSGTVTFTNSDSEAHTVTTDAGQPETFNSGILAPDASFEHTFASSPGTVNVHCDIHPAMRATVFVQ